MIKKLMPMSRAGLIAALTLAPVACGPQSGGIYGWVVPWQTPVPLLPVPIADLWAVIEDQFEPTQVFWRAPNGNKVNADGTPMVATQSRNGWAEESLGGELAFITAAPMAGWGLEWAAGANSAGQVFVKAYNGSTWDANWTNTGGSGPAPRSRSPAPPPGSS